MKMASFGAGSSNARGQPVVLSGIPVITLSNSRTRASTQDPSQNFGTDALVADEGNDEVSSKIRTKVVPRPDDEPPVVCRLAGYSISTYVELCGWSRLVPTKFFSINRSTQLHPMTNHMDELVEPAEDLRARAITLREMEGLIGGTVICSPVFVHVVGKRKVDIIPYKHRVLVIPQVIIADNSGYCTLCSMNEGYATIYSEVEVGDIILISRCLPQRPRNTYHNGLFSDDMFLNLELKLQYHTVRHHYIWRFNILKKMQFCSPPALFDNICTLKMPSDLEKHWERKQPIDDVPYFDLMGIVTYVGRIERFHNVDAAELECVEDSQIVLKPIARYLAIRWIHLVDRTSKLLLVKVYVDNTTLDDQPKLVPGAIVVLSSCQTVSCPYSGNHITTTPFSQIFAEAGLERYLMLRPAIFCRKAVDLLSRNSYLEIVSRQDIQLSLGGTRALKITNSDNFLKFYYDKGQRLLKGIPEEKPLGRRESRRLHFKGLILRVLEVQTEDCLRPVLVDQVNYSPEKKKRETGQYKVLENFLPYTRFRNSSWFAFQYKLPAIDPLIMQEDKCRDIVKKVVKAYKPFCGPLLMPADIENYNESGPPPAMANFEKLDGTPYLLLDIVNEEKNNWYHCIWKNRNFTAQEMMEKAMAAKDKKVYCLVEVYCTELAAPLEVALLDFVISDEN